MLSILIPTFNYDVTALVTEVHKQSIACKIEFEILVYDDASTDLKVRKNNTSINALEDTSYTILKSNIGRSAIRNKLAKTAQYEWLLFLDADVMTVNDNFVSNYINSLSDSKPIINGGNFVSKRKTRAITTVTMDLRKKKRSSEFRNKKKKPTYKFTFFKFFN
jgi:glycosyltransferase involved in cell wall biosynthesis